MEKRIFLSPPHMGGEEQKFINDAFKINFIAPLGPNVDNFERDIVNFTSAGNCAALSSGTAAIHLALILLGVKSGDDVIVPSFTFSATVNPIAYLQANPVFIDSEPETWNMDPDLLEQAIKDGIQRNRKPKAVIIVHLYGMPAKMHDLIDICNRYQIPVIEDAAEALGSRYKSKHLGTFGDIGIYSFNGNKIITTSGGGALVSKNEEIVKKARFLATQARDKASHYQHSHVGYNYRMSNILAGIGRGQMMVLNKWIEKRREINRFYRELFSNTEGVDFLSEPSDEYFSNYWLTTLYIDSSKSGFSNKDISLQLESFNIETRPLWKPMHLQPVFKQKRAHLNGISEKLFNQGICLPSGSNLDESDKKRIADALIKFIRN